MSKTVACAKSVMATRIVLAIIVISINVNGEVKSQDSLRAARSSPIPGIGEHLEKVRLAKTSRDTMNAYEAVFRVAGRNGIEQLKHGTDDGIAIQAEWNEVVHDSLIGRTIAIGTGNEVRLSQKRLSRFVGFVEGRLKVSVPRWWENVVLSGKVGKRPDVVLDFDVEKNAPNVDSGFGVFVAPGTKLSRRGKHTVIAAGNESVTVPARIAKSYGNRDSTNYCQCLSTLVQPEKWYQVLYSSLGESAGLSKLDCIDRTSGKVVWSTAISANHEFVVYRQWVRPGRPTGSHVIGLKQQGEHLLMFGAENSSIYINCFSITDGTTRFRVSSDYR